MLDMFRSRKRSYLPRKSYSQTGEDIIVDFIFQGLSVTKPTYIDVGANDPWKYNNTALFYEKGSSGISIEPDPNLFNKLKDDRPRDINLNIGIAMEEGVLDLFLMDVDTLSTFSVRTVSRYETEFKYRVKKVLPVQTKPLNWVIENYAGSKFPDFLSLDAEGVDEIVLHSIDFGGSYPKVICVETIDFYEKGPPRKNEAIAKFLKGQGYLLFADTHINSIFVKQQLWENRQ